MTGSPATADNPIRVLIANTSIPLDQPADHLYGPTEFNVQVDVYNQDSQTTKQILVESEEFNLTPGETRESVIYTVGGSALKLVGDYKPPSNGGPDYIGASAPFGKFALFCEAE
jgi:hypothetical protein